MPLAPPIGVVVVTPFFPLGDKTDLLLGFGSAAAAVCVGAAASVRAGGSKLGKGRTVNKGRDAMLPYTLYELA